jgi:DNA processing protein
MISANFALEMSRDVLAIPGSVHNPMARGCHKLIKDGAKLCENAADVLDELKISSKRLKLNQLQAEQTDEVLLAIGTESMSIDELCAKLNLAFDELCGKLLEYELDGKIVSCGGGRYQQVFK